MTHSNNVFLTTENLAFSLPLLVVCGAYAYFTFIPLYIGGPILVLLGLFILVKSQVKAIKDKKLENLDEDFIKDLAGESEEEIKTKKQQEEAAKARKAKAKLEQRLAIEQKKLRQQMNGGKKKNKKSESTTAVEDDDEALELFVKKKTK